MPRAASAELPDAIRNHLPEHAQDILREAFDHAWRQYADDSRLEEIFFREEMLMKTDRQLQGDVLAELDWDPAIEAIGHAPQ